MAMLLISLLAACIDSTSSDEVVGDCDCPETETTPGDTTGTDTAPPGDTGKPTSEHVQVYLLGGQSNMDGHGYTTGLPPSLQTAQDDVLIYWSGRPQWSGLYPSSYATQYYGTEHFGPEVTFGRTMADKLPNERIVLIKHAVGGTDLAVCWNPGAYTDDPNMGTCYSDWRATVQDALAALEEPYEIAGMIWMQGESDAYNAEWAAVYEENLRHLIERVREDVSTDDMPFAMGIIDCPTCPYRDTVRYAQSAIANESTLIHAVETEDLPQNLDNIHFDASGMRTLGERLAIVLLNQTTDVPTPQPAFSFTGGALSNYTGNFVVGYTFTNDDWIIVTDLGTLDYDWDGLSNDATVVLWDAQTQAVLARATVPSQASGPSSIWGGWRFVAIEPIALPPGEYIIGAQVYNGSADRYLHNAMVSAAEGLSWGEGRHANGTAIQYPTIVTDAEASWFGPNFLFLGL